MIDSHIQDPVIARQTPRADFSIDQCWSEYSADEHAVWDLLYTRQLEILSDRAAPEFIDGLNTLELDVFFTHLANRRFPAGRFIRQRDQLDYLQEPDIFHDIFGHVPMLTNPVFADYMQAYGQGGLRALGLGTLNNLARLYWYTVEFGLIKRPEGLRIYGAGIVSSYGECQYALENADPNRIEFNLERIMRTEYEIDKFQKTYFVIEDYAQLFNATQQDFGPIYERLKTQDNRYSSSEISNEDNLVL